MVLRSLRLSAETSYPVEGHGWGEFVYSFRGMVELSVGQGHFLTPPHYGLWLPPGAVHGASTRPNTSYCILDITEELCGPLPDTVCSLEVSGIVKAILTDLVAREVTHARTESDERLMNVLIDQMSQASRRESYLPTSADRALGRVLEYLRQDPGDDRSLAEWADVVHSTERTLARRCRRDLGMSFLEWRQRLRLFQSLSMLQDGQKVQVVATAMGYRTSSAFIAMFNRMTGSTPDEFRKRSAPFV